MNPGLPRNLAEPLGRFLTLLDRWNRTHALTALPFSERKEELLLDAAALLPFLAPLGAGSRVVDLGTGMGIPSVLLALARPDLDVIGVDEIGGAGQVALVRDGPEIAQMVEVQIFHIVL